MDALGFRDIMAVPIRKQTFKQPILNDANRRHMADFYHPAPLSSQFEPYQPLVCFHEMVGHVTL